MLEAPNSAPAQVYNLMQLGMGSSSVEKQGTAHGGRSPLGYAERLSDSAAAVGLDCSVVSLPRM